MLDPEAYEHALFKIIQNESLHRLDAQAVGTACE
jgi:hypothetical protein